MHSLQRNQLVWLHPQAWQVIAAQPWDAQALQVLNHWATRALPLVVARQREGVLPDRICLGLPAPAQWHRRRLSLDVAQSDISACGVFPELSSVADAFQWGPASRQLTCELKRLNTHIHVYGSYGWQTLTGMSYVHGLSDLDVVVGANTVYESVQLAERLNTWRAPCRLDGEIAFGSGHAVAWRELLQADQGQVSQVLVKHRGGAELMTPDALQTRIAAQANLQRKSALCAI